MAYNPQAIFAKLIEKERLKGHHSPEGRAIRNLSRAMSGWSAGNLSVLDVLVLCDQSMEDWLKARLQQSVWSTQDLSTLLEKAVGQGLITRTEAVRVQKLHDARVHVHTESRAASAQKVEAALEFYLRLLERHW